jgi:hypothetical protein
MGSSDRNDREIPASLRKTVDRAIWRLGLLEWTILFGAALLALAGGAIAALLLAELLGLPFRIVWIGASLALFGGPALGYLIRERRTDR